MLQCVLISDAPDCAFRKSLYETVPEQNLNGPAGQQDDVLCMQSRVTADGCGNETFSGTGWEQDGSSCFTRTFPMRWRRRMQYVFGARDKERLMIRNGCFRSRLSATVSPALPGPGCPAIVLTWMRGQYRHRFSVRERRVRSRSGTSLHERWLSDANPEFAMDRIRLLAYYF